MILKKKKYENAVFIKMKIWVSMKMMQSIADGVEEYFQAN